MEIRIVKSCENCEYIEYLLSGVHCGIMEIGEKNEHTKIKNIKKIREDCPRKWDQSIKNLLKDVLHEFETTDNLLVTDNQENYWELNNSGLEERIKKILEI